MQFRGYMQVPWFVNLFVGSVLPGLNGCWSFGEEALASSGNKALNKREHGHTADARSTYETSQRICRMYVSRSRVPGRSTTHSTRSHHPSLVLLGMLTGMKRGLLRTAIVVTVSSKKA